MVSSYVTWSGHGLIQRNGYASMLYSTTVLRREDLGNSRDGCISNPTKMIFEMVRPSAPYDVSSKDQNECNANNYGGCYLHRTPI